MLWFDVEVRYNTTGICHELAKDWLWFDVEVRYNTTIYLAINVSACCGLM